MDSVIKLILANPTQREDGTWTTEPTEREVLCKVQSVSRKEFFANNREGMNPALRFDVFAAEYNGETLVEYNGARYSVYRTHQSDANTYVGQNLRKRQELMMDYIELYVQREGGTVEPRSTASPPGGRETGG